MGNKIMVAGQTRTDTSIVVANNTRLRFFKGELREERAPRNAECSLKHYENISREVLGVLQTHALKDMPPAAFFKRIGRSDIVSAANVYYDGILGLRAEMLMRGDLKLDG